MGSTYTRQSTFTDGDTITANLFNTEFDQLVATFAATTGHSHDGTTGEGGPIAGMLSHALTFGAGTAGTDIVCTFDGESNNGIFKWMEDEDYFEFSDDLLIASTEKLQFRDTAIYINSSTDGQLDIVADTEIQIAATTIDINGAVVLNGAITGATNITLSGELDAATLDISGNADIDGNLDVGGNLTVTGTTTFNGGTLTLGDAASDNIVFGADVNSSIIPNTDSTFDLGSTSQEWRDLFIDGTAHIDTLDVDANATVAGTLGVTGVLTTTDTQVATGGITSGSNIVSDTDSTDDLGTTSVRWANLFVDGITATDQITATGFTGTLDGILGSGTAAAATVTTLDTSGAVNLNLVTDSTSSTSGALVVDGGVGIAKKLFVGTDLDVEGTTNLDAVDIDGAVQLDATLTVGANDQGYDVILYGDTASANMTWDTSADDLIFNGDAGLIVPVGQLTLGSTAVTSTAAELNALDGITAVVGELNALDLGSTAVGTAIASKAMVLDSNKDYTGVRNFTLSGELDAGSLDISGNVDIDGTLETDALSINGAAVTSTAAELNALDGITAVVGELNALDLGSTAVGTAIASKAVVLDSSKDYTGVRNFSITGNLSVGGTTTVVDTVTMNAQNAVLFEGATADAHETTLSIVDPTADRTINLPNQSGTVPVLAAASNTAVTSTPEELNALDGITAVVGELNALDLGSTAVGTAIASKAMILDSNKDYTGVRNFTLSGELDAGSLDVSGDVDVDGTLETDALSISGTAVTSTAAEINLIDGGTSRGTTAVADGDGVLINDAGTMRMTSVDTLSTYMSGKSVGGSSIVTTGALNSGTITSGFGNIDTGSSTITTTGLITGGSLDIDDVAINGKAMTMTGSSSDTAVFTVGTNGTLSIVTTDDAAAAANIQITADGTAELAGTTVTLDSGGDIDLAATNDVNLPANVGLTFGNDGEKIEGDGTNLAINSSGDLNVTATTIDIDGNVEISGTAVTTGVHTFTAVPVFPNNTVETADIQADAITGAKIADDAINSEHYTDGSIDTAHIADDQITLAKMAGIARGKLIVGNSGGNPAVIGPGNNGQVLTSDGTDIAFADAGGGGADLYNANESSPTAQPNGSGANAIAIGDGALAAGEDGLAFGIASKARAATSVGIFGDAQGIGSISIGQGSSVSANYGVALGFSSIVTAIEAVALSKSRATGTDSFAAVINNNTSSYGALINDGIAIGNLAKAGDAVGAMAIGNANICSGGQAAVVGGHANNGAGNWSFISGGNSNVTTADAPYARVGGYQGKVNLHAADVYSGGNFAAVGDAQRATYILRSDTTDDTAEQLTTVNAAPAAHRIIALPNNSAFAFSAMVVAREKASEGTEAAAFKIEGLIRREGDAASTTLVASTATVLSNANSFALAATADTTNGGLALTVTGKASTNIRFVATVHTTEVTYA